jgi:DNA-directed RNA polymerase subunit F
MIGKESKYISNASLSEVLEILEKRKKEKDLTYEQQVAYDHASKFAGSKSTEQKLKKGLEELGYLSPNAIVTILNLMPKSEMLLRQILASEKKTFADEDVKKILSIVNQK